MKIAIVGAGFTGLSAAHTLVKKNHTVTLFEKESFLGGLAGTFRQKSWDWPLERHYHHWFSNDTSALSLIRELGLGKYLIFPKTITSIYYKEKMYPFNNAHDVLSFSPLPFSDRIRTGLVTAYLKILPPKHAIKLELQTAHQWLLKRYGKKAYSIIWEPLLIGKFGPFARSVNMAWFWARIYKRTPRLGYLVGGYEKLVQSLAQSIQNKGGLMQTNSSFHQKQIHLFDKTIITTPSTGFVKMFPQLPNDYKDRLISIPHLHAYNLVLITKKKILDSVYWLNINDRSFPFLAVVAQTNLIDAKHYGGNHITWIGNYLPSNHSFFQLSKKQLLEKFIPYIQKINPLFQPESWLIDYELFFGPSAQPVFPLNYSKLRPNFNTPIPNVYLANMDMVYPWDRGTNYAIEMGQQIARLIEEN